MTGDPLNKRLESRRIALARPCPKCGAAVGELCVGVRGTRKALHIQRYRYKPSEAVSNPNWGQRSEVENDDGTKLPGLYPWLRFEPITRDRWIELYGIDLQHIDRKAAETYLEDEADFFESFDEDYPSFNKQGTLEDRRDQFANAAANLCQSPIEQVFLAALLWLSYGYGAWVEIWDSSLPFEAPDAGVVISPQHQIGDYRVDFAIFLNHVPYEQIKFVVECDGHDFHEKTKQQAARDKKRDRELQIAGWKVLRFTGSEIWRDRDVCAVHVDSMALRAVEEQLRLGDRIKPR